MKMHRRASATLIALVSVTCLCAWSPNGVTAAVHRLSVPFRTLIVGGGPDLAHNQVAIESNVRYVERILPSSAKIRVLFTDGDPQSKTVLYQDADDKQAYRASQIPRIDGPSSLGKVQSELSSISEAAAANPSGPVLLYFTGHGGPGGGPDFTGNHYDLWDHQEFNVTSFASSLKSFPKTTPITLVMVECFSGAFGNLLFKDGDPKAPLADLNICGFFASVPNRMAAGCTPEINEANYRDFTSYFFAALAGVDRLGNPVTGADYNRDGKVGMNEAFAYSLIHDDSIDTPVCTSDVFLRRFVPAKDEEVLATPYGNIRGWATPAQGAALDALSRLANLSGPDRAQRAYNDFLNMSSQTEDRREIYMYRFVRLAKSVVLAHMLEASANESVKVRFAQLLEAESKNPLH